jgi:apolipoprotein N-acyltransferase
MWTADIERPTQDMFPHRAAFNALRTVLDALTPTPLLRAGFWLLACIALCWIGWNRPPREATFVLSVCGSAAVYVLTFYGVGVASDFRYGYWAVLAAMSGGVVLLAGQGGRPLQKG